MVQILLITIEKEGQRMRTSPAYLDKWKRQGWSVVGGETPGKTPEAVSSELASDADKMAQAQGERDERAAAEAKKEDDGAALKKVERKVAK